MRTFVLSLLFLVATASVALAHTPIFLKPGEQARVINDPERSWAIYGKLKPGETDVIPLEAKAGQRLTLQLLVPQRPALREFRPRVELTGPATNGEGALVLPEPQAPSEFYEPFTQTRYWTYGEARGTFPDTGRYRISVSDPSGKGGSYTLALGDREQFGLKDALTFPLTWLKVRGWYKR